MVMVIVEEPDDETKLWLAWWDGCQGRKEKKMKRGRSESESDERLALGRAGSITTCLFLPCWLPGVVVS